MVVEPCHPFEVCVFVHHRQTLDLAAVGSGVEDEVAGTHQAPFVGPAQGSGLGECANKDYADLWHSTAQKLRLALLGSGLK